MNFVRLVALAFFVGLISLLIIVALNLDSVRCRMKQASVQTQCARIHKAPDCENAAIAFVESTVSQEKFQCQWISNSCDGLVVCSD